MRVFDTYFFLGQLVRKEAPLSTEFGQPFFYARRNLAERRHHPLTTEPREGQANNILASHHHLVHLVLDERKANAKRDTLVNFTWICRRKHLREKSK